MIKVTGLEKTFHIGKREMKKKALDKRTVEAVRGIDFEVKPGEIYGLLGPNGAGKTTTLRCISTLMRPTRGTVEVGGLNTVTAGERVRERISFLTNDLKLDEHFSPDFTMKFFGELREMPPKTIEERKDVLFEALGMKGFKNQPIKEFSTGMRQKLAIAVSLLHDPEVIVFDEPTNGLDVITARTVTELLLAMKEDKKTILVSTHEMSVAEELCDRIGILISGSLVMEGTLEHILKTTGTRSLADAFFWLYKEYGGENG